MPALRVRKGQLSRWWTVPPVVIVLAFTIFLEKMWPTSSGVDPIPDLVSGQCNLVRIRVRRCMACTEFPLIIKQSDVTLPVFDTTRLHSQMAVDFILGKPGLAYVQDTK